MPLLQIIGVCVLDMVTMVSENVHKIVVGSREKLWIRIQIVGKEFQRGVSLYKFLFQQNERHFELLL